jgi:hypothetical protein
VRVAVCGLAVLVCLFAMFLSGRSVLLSFLGSAMIVMMGGLQVMVSRRLVVGGSLVMMLARGVLLLFSHRKSP